MSDSLERLYIKWNVIKRKAPNQGLKAALDRDMEDKSVSVKILIKQMDLFDVHFNSTWERQSVNESFGEQWGRKPTDKRREKLHQKSIEIGASARHCSIVFPFSIYFLRITLFVVLAFTDGDNKNTSKELNYHPYHDIIMTTTKWYWSNFKMKSAMNQRWISFHYWTVSQWLENL